MYIVFCHVPLKSRHLASLEKAEEGEATGCRLCCCMLNTQVTHLWPHAADQEQEINFVWPKIVPGRRRCPLVRRPDKGGFTAL